MHKILSPRAPVFLLNKINFKVKHNFSLTIWTGLLMKDVDVTIPGEQLVEELRGRSIPIRITTGVTARMLGAGWLLYLASIILNFIFYKMHPSSPEMWTWGAEEKLEEWTPPEETQEEGEFGFSNI